MLPLRVFLGIFIAYTAAAALCQLRLPDDPAKHNTIVLASPAKRSLVQAVLKEARVTDHTFFKTAVTPNGIRLVADPITCKWHLSGDSFDEGNS